MRGAHEHAAEEHCFWDRIHASRSGLPGQHGTGHQTSRDGDRLGRWSRSPPRRGGARAPPRPRRGRGRAGDLRSDCSLVGSEWSGDPLFDPEHDERGRCGRNTRDAWRDEVGGGSAGDDAGSSSGHVLRLRPWILACRARRARFRSTSRQTGRFARWTATWATDDSGISTRSR